MKTESQYCDIIESIQLDMYPTFSLEKAVCNHGLFMMAPNCWIPSRKTLQRPLRLSDSTTSLLVSIFSYSTNSLVIRVHNTRYLSYADHDYILAQVRRMLRISKKDENDVEAFHKLHPQAKESGFGRIFRSPTLFEDVVKSILLCNCGWGRTLEMAEALCKLQLELANRVNGGKTKKGKKQTLEKKRKRSSSDEGKVSRNHNVERKSVFNFPDSKELAAVDEEFLRTRCNLGYRAVQIVQIAKSFESHEELKFIKEFEDHAIFDTNGYDNLFTTLLKLKGFGRFTCANILMCCGSYQRIPEDSETVRHLLTFHARKDCNKKNVQQVTKEVYGKYAPFQCLAYWWELLEWYEEKIGKLNELPRSSYCIVTGTSRKK